MVIHIYVTRQRHVENLLLLKKLHPDISVPEELRDSAAAIEALEPREGRVHENSKHRRICKGHSDYGGGMDIYWKPGLAEKDRFIHSFYMLLIMKESRWTVRPAISKEKVKGYGFEVPVDTVLSEVFLKHLRKGELEEIHDHVENKHFHLTMDSLKRCVELAGE